MLTQWHSVSFMLPVLCPRLPALSAPCPSSPACRFLSPLLPAWDPSLAFVMGGALAVSLPAFQLIKRRAAAPLCLASFSLPAKQAIDKPLLLGAAMFGAGEGALLSEASCGPV